MSAGLDIGQHQLGSAEGDRELIAELSGLGQDSLDMDTVAVSGLGTEVRQGGEGRDPPRGASRFGMADLHRGGFQKGRITGEDVR